MLQADALCSEPHQNRNGSDPAPVSLTRLDLAPFDARCPRPQAIEQAIADAHVRQPHAWQDFNDMTLNDVRVCDAAHVERWNAVPIGALRIPRTRCAKLLTPSTISARAFEEGFAFKEHAGFTDSFTEMTRSAKALRMAEWDITRIRTLPGLRPPDQASKSLTWLKAAIRLLKTGKTFALANVEQRLKLHLRNGTKKRAIPPSGLDSIS